MESDSAEPQLLELSHDECFALLATRRVDQIDEVTHAGWSVLVKGLAEEITPAHAAELVDRTKAVAPTPWAPGEHDHWMRLIPHYVSGRRLMPGALADFFEAAAYL